MNILLLMPKIISQPEEWYVFPMGIAYVSSSLKQHNKWGVFTKNLNTVSDIAFTINEEIKKHNIDVVATGGLSIQYHAIRDIVTNVKKCNPSVITIVGGGYITSAPEVAMRAIPDIDIGVIGEGEYTIRELTDAIEKGTSLNQVAGIIFRDADNNLCETCGRKPIENLDVLPYPDYDGFNFESTLNYSPVNFGIYGHRSAVLLTSRGCPYNCTFCFHPQGDMYRSRDLDCVFAELEWLIDRYKIESVLVLDELFGGNQKRLIEFCDRIEKLNLQWWVETRVQFATMNNLQRMKDSGCAQVLLGIENVNDSILESMNKHITVKEIESALKNAYEIGLSAPGVLIFGDPAENETTAENTIAWWLAHPEYNIVLTTVQVYPGSTIWDYAIQTGKLPTIESQIEYIRSGCPKLNISGLDDNSFANLCKRIGKLSQQRTVRVVDSSIANEVWKNGKVKADVSGRCARCNANNFWPMVNLLAEGGGEENFICSECGQAHVHSFYSRYFEIGATNLYKLAQKVQHVAIWGQGRRLSMMFDSHFKLSTCDFFYVDNSPAKWGHKFYELTINNPQTLLDANVDVLVVAVGDAHMEVIQDKIKVMSRKKGMPIAKKTILLGELFNPKYEV